MKGKIDQLHLSRVLLSIYTVKLKTALLALLKTRTLQAANASEPHMDFQFWCVLFFFFSLSPYSTDSKKK